MIDNKSVRVKDLDRIDRNILNELQKDGRISNVELSNVIGSVSDSVSGTCAPFRASGFITGYTALLNPALSGCLPAGIRGNYP